MTRAREPDAKPGHRARTAARGSDNGSGAPMYSLESEEGLLGRLLLGSRAATAIVAMVRSDDFSSGEHRLIFQAIAKLARDGNVPDPLSVKEQLEGMDHLEAAGGLARLGELARGAPSPDAIQQYAERVIELATLRRVQEIIEDRLRGPDLRERLEREVGRLRGTQAASPRLTTIDFARMQPYLADGQVVKGLIGRGSLVAAIGATGSGKTFFSTDLALHIAAKRPWRGLTIHGGLAAYAALEGPGSAVNRFVAARQAGGFPAGIPLRLTPGPINLRAPADVQVLIDFVRQAERDHGEKCAVVFIDTVSRAIAGGDENTSEDMGALIAGADAVRLATGATAFLVHHLGKDESRGARGHSSLKAALDTEIELAVKPDGLHVATVTKQRDLPGGAQFAFRLKVVELGRDADDDPVTSCIVEHINNVPVERRAPRGKNQEALLSALTEWRRQHPDYELISTVELQQIARSQKLDRSRRREAIEKLNEYGYLAPCTGGYRILTEDPR